MREYLFRGKRKDNGEWVMGCLVSVAPDEAFILVGITGHIKRDDYQCYMLEVVPETAGQYVDRKDNAGIKVFQGDILQTKDKYSEGITLVRWNRIRCKYEGTCISPNGDWIENGIDCGADSFSMYTKIGNLFDNPELLNPTSGQSGIKNMQDPNVKQPDELKEAEQATNAQESESQDKAMEVNSEEGTTEG